jgi:hypothetical protein
MWTVEAIGETAGQVWAFLNQHGRCSLNAVKLGVVAPKSQVDMAIGWLAREGKIDLSQEKRSIQVWLKEA